LKLLQNNCDNIAHGKNNTIKIIIRKQKKEIKKWKK